MIVEMRTRDPVSGYNYVSIYVGKGNKLIEYALSGRFNDHYILEWERVIVKHFSIKNVDVIDDHNRIETEYKTFPLFGKHIRYDGSVVPKLTAFISVMFPNSFEASTIPERLTRYGMVAREIYTTYGLTPPHALANMYPHDLPVWLNHIDRDHAPKLMSDSFIYWTAQKIKFYNK